MISVQGLSVEFSDKVLFENIGFVINDHEKIALVGRNGAGKSTLLKIIAGLQKPNSGAVSKPNGLTVGYLPQHMVFDDNCTLLEEADKAFGQVNELAKSIDDLNAEIQSRTDYDSDEYQGLINKLVNLTEQQAQMQSENYEAAIEKTLLGLGFERSDFGRATSKFSGGWRMRVELAKILLRKPDVFLLDEPTNHLDIESIQWLETFLKTSSSAILLVSHDKAFLDNVTTRTIEITLGDIYDYKVNYSKFLELRKERIEQQKRAYENQQKMIQDTEDFIEKFRYKATKSTQVQSRVKQLAKIQRIEIDDVDTTRLRLKFPAASRSGDYPVIAQDLHKAYGDHTVFSDVTFTIKRGEKVAFVGKNGAGKSTLVKCIMGEIPYDGNLKIGHNVEIGYFAQNQAQLLDNELTVHDTIDLAATGDVRKRINDILGAFMFGGKASEKKVKVLSGGERARLAMIKFLLQPVNLLILDEPTNHLDIPSKEVLKDAIKDFGGTVIVVSHDRDFLDGLVEKVYEFGNGKVKEHLGGIRDFLQEKQIESLHELEANKNVSSKAAETVTEAPVSASKADYFEQKEQQKKLRSCRKRVEDIEKEIEKLDKEIENVENELNTNPGGDLQDAYKAHAELSGKREQLMDDWEKATEELDEMENLFTNK